MMDRREFLRRSAIVAAGAVAANQIEILERLTHERKFFPGFTPTGTHGYVELLDMCGKVMGRAPWNGQSQHIGIIKEAYGKRLLHREVRAYRLVVTVSGSGHADLRLPQILSMDRPRTEEVRYTFQLIGGI